MYDVFRCTEIALAQWLSIFQLQRTMHKSLEATVTVKLQIITDKKNTLKNSTKPVYKFCYISCDFPSNNNNETKIRMNLKENS